MAKGVLGKKRFRQGDFFPGELERIASVLRIDISAVLALINEHKEDLVKFQCFSLNDNKLIANPEILFASQFLAKINVFRVRGEIEHKDIGALYRILDLLMPEALELVRTMYMPKDIFEVAQSRAENEILLAKGRQNSSERDYLNKTDEHRKAVAENKRLEATVRRLSEILHINIDRIVPPVDS